MPRRFKPTGIFYKTKKHAHGVSFCWWTIRGAWLRQNFTRNQNDDIPFLVRFCSFVRTLVNSKALTLYLHQTKRTPWVCVLFGGRSGTRTLGPLIKSQLLYQLS